MDFDEARQNVHVATFYYIAYRSNRSCMPFYQARFSSKK